MELGIANMTLPADEQIFLSLLSKHMREEDKMQILQDVFATLQ